MKKRIICLVVSLITVFSVCAEASVLGSKLQYSYNYEISDGLKLIKNRFLSDQEGVGNQTENYFIYTPNASTRPIVTLGEYVYGGEDINEIYDYLKYIFPNQLKKTLENKHQHQLNHLFL